MWLTVTKPTLLAITEVPSDHLAAAIADGTMRARLDLLAQLDALVVVIVAVAFIHATIAVAARVVAFELERFGKWLAASLPRGRLDDGAAPLAAVVQFLIVDGPERLFAVRVALHLHRLLPVGSTIFFVRT